MKRRFLTDKDGNNISFVVKDTFVYDSDGTSISDILTELRNKINAINVPSDGNYRWYFNNDENTLYLYQGDTVISSTEINIPSGNVIPPDTVHNISCGRGNECLKLKWEDPDDTVIEGITIVSWNNTKLVIKAGSAPVNDTDGIVYENTLRNQYKDTPLVVDNLVNNTEYYIRFFTYTANGTQNSDESSVVTGTPKSAIVYGFHVNNNDSNPTTCVTYLEDAIGKTPVHMDNANGVFDWGGGWTDDEFFMPRPCMLKYDGTVDYYLDTNDYAKKEDGTFSDVSNTSYGGNAMIEWGRDGKKIWYKLVPDSDNDSSYSVYISDDKVDDGYVCWNFYDCNNHVCNHFYTPIYNGSYINSCIRSLSGQTPGTSSSSGTNEISYARKNNTLGGLTGDMWYTETYGDRMLVNYLLVLLGKSLDTQTVYGNGRCEIDSTHNTGIMNDKGMFWGSTTSRTSGVKVFGMENWWGNIHRRTAGLCTDDSYYYYYKLTPNTADGSTSSSYPTSYSGMINSNTRLGSTRRSGYITSFKVVGDTILPSSVSRGSETTYYCDYVSASSSNDFVLCGGTCDDGSYCGSFYLNLSYAFTYPIALFGCALSFRGE